MLFVAILLMGGLEIIGIASILPFMEMLSYEDPLQQSKWLARAYDYFEFTSVRQMLIYFGISLIAVIGLTNIFSVLTIWWKYKFSWSIAHNVATRLLAHYLIKPYAFYLNNHTANIQTYVISEVNVLTSGVLIPIIEIISRSTISIVIFGILLLVDTKVSLIMFGSLGSAYALIYISRRGFLKRIGQHRIKMNTLRHKSIKEVLEGFKTVKIYHKQNFFFQRYAHASKEFTDVQPKFNLLLNAPKYLLEFVAFGGILAITIYLYIEGGGITQALPRLSLYAFAGYRLLPALQRAFTALAKVKHNFPVVERLSEELDTQSTQKMLATQNVKPLIFKRQIELRNLSFQYQSDLPLVVKNISVEIPKGQTVAFIGSTGSGKTTLIDTVVGLLYATDGNILIDGQILSPEEVIAWQKNIAYVPQEVFLFDDTVMRNIALNELSHEVDMARLESSSRMAGIHDFIINDMPKGFQTSIGDRGVRLSGGQRQRIGLARALYAQPSLLVLDEATSALDSITESGIMASLNAVTEDITTIIIAHRLSTVKHADQIYFLKDGEIVANGTYDSLLHTNDTFKTMVELS